MSLILQIESATTACSVALAKDGCSLAVKQVNERNVHAEVITRFIEGVMKQAGFAYDQLDAVAVSGGPGSYTGLRIGISTAKGLCFALGKPLIAIETLEGMAAGISNSSLKPENDVLLCPMIDARRMEVYTAVFDQGGNKVTQTAAEIIGPDSFAGLLENNRILFFGDGAAKCAGILGANGNAVFLPGFVNSAVNISKLAQKKFEAGDFEDVAYFEPCYLKDFIAGKKL